MYRNRLQDVPVNVLDDEGRIISVQGIYLEHDYSDRVPSD
jgi:hypothetical protein